MHSLWRELHGNQASSSCAPRSSGVKSGRDAQKSSSACYWSWIKTHHAVLGSLPSKHSQRLRYTGPITWNYTTGRLKDCFINSGIAGSEFPTAFDHLNSTVVMTVLISADQVGWIVSRQDFSNDSWHHPHIYTSACKHVKWNCWSKLVQLWDYFSFLWPNRLSCISSSQTMDCRPNGLFLH